jgi:hypothetical protein
LDPAPYHFNYTLRFRDQKAAAAVLRHDLQLLRGMRRKDSDNPTRSWLQQRQPDLIGRPNFESCAVALQVLPMGSEEETLPADIQNPTYSEIVAFEPATRQSISDIPSCRGFVGDFRVPSVDSVCQRGHLAAEPSGEQYAEHKSCQGSAKTSDQQAASQFNTRSDHPKHNSHGNTKRNARDPGESLPIPGFISVIDFTWYEVFQARFLTSRAWRVYNRTLFPARYFSLVSVVAGIPLRPSFAGLLFCGHSSKA